MVGLSLYTVAHLALCDDLATASALHIDLHFICDYLVCHGL